MLQITPTFLHLNLTTQTFEVKSYEELIPKVGGLGWALSLFEKFQRGEPIILSLGSLNNIFPGASKTVAVFRSPQTGGLATSLGGGSLSRFLRFAGYQGLVITGKAPATTLVSVDEEGADFRQAQSLVGLEVPKVFEQIFSSEGVPSRRSVMVSGPAAERDITFAPLYIDEFFSFARGGLGLAFASKNLKGLVVSGAKSESITDRRRYDEVFLGLMKRLKGYQELSKLGTLRNLAVEKKIAAVPSENLGETAFIFDRLLAPKFLKEMGGERVSCSGCPVGCIHLFRLDKEFAFYDYEGVVALGPLLGIADPIEVGRLLKRSWALGMDPTSLGVILAHVTEKEGLNFGSLDTYLTLIEALFEGKESWSKELRGGLPPDSEALTLGGMEFLPYFNGYASVLSQLLRLGATTEENRGFILDLELLDKEIDSRDVISRLVAEEEKKTLSELLVGCGYLAGIFEDPAVAFAALEALGNSFSHEGLTSTAKEVFLQKLALQRLLGFNPLDVKIPKKFLKVPSAQGFLKKKKLREMVGIYTDEIFESSG